MMCYSWNTTTFYYNSQHTQSSNGHMHSPGWLPILLCGFKFDLVIYKHREKYGSHESKCPSWDHSGTTPTQTKQ